MDLSKLGGGLVVTDFLDFSQSLHLVFQKPTGVWVFRRVRIVLSPLRWSCILHRYKTYLDLFLYLRSMTESFYKGSSLSTFHDTACLRGKRSRVYPSQGISRAEAVSNSSEATYSQQKTETRCRDYQGQRAGGSRAGDDSARVIEQYQQESKIKCRESQEKRG